MTVMTSAGSVLAVAAGNPATYDVSGYEALFGGSPGGLTVGEITDFGEFGREFALVTHNPVATRGTQKFKGSFNEGTMQLQIGADTEDEGQELMRQAADDDAPYSFRLTAQNGDIYYFQAMVMSWRLSVGGVDSITSASCVLELTTNKDGVGVVRDLAAAP